MLLGKKSAITCGYVKGEPRNAPSNVKRIVNRVACTACIRFPKSETRMDIYRSTLRQLEPWSLSSVGDSTHVPGKSSMVRFSSVVEIFLLVFSTQLHYFCFLYSVGHFGSHFAAADADGDFSAKWAFSSLRIKNKTDAVRRWLKEMIRH